MVLYTNVIMLKKQDISWNTLKDFYTVIKNPLLTHKTLQIYLHNLWNKYAVVYHAVAHTA